MVLPFVSTLSESMFVVACFGEVPYIARQQTQGKWVIILTKGNNLFGLYT
jgi:hypothetical protein